MFTKLSNKVQNFVKKPEVKETAKSLAAMAGVIVLSAAAAWAISYAIDPEATKEEWLKKTGQNVETPVEETVVE